MSSIWRTVPKKHQVIAKLLMNTHDCLQIIWLAITVCNSKTTRTNRQCSVLLDHIGVFRKKEIFLVQHGCSSPLQNEIHHRSTKIHEERLGSSRASSPIPFQSKPEGKGFQQSKSQEWHHVHHASAFSSEWFRLPLTSSSSSTGSCLSFFSFFCLLLWRPSSSSRLFKKLRKKRH